MLVIVVLFNAADVSNDRYKMKLKLKRKPNWQVFLNIYLEKTVNKKFRMGRFDCCIFVSGAVKAMTGVDGMKEFRRNYTSIKSSKKALKEIGSGSLYSTLRSKLGNPVPAAQGFKGDIAYNDGRLGIVLGHKVIFLTDGGFHLTPISQVDKAFRISF